jgi:hypothetical protein
MRLLKANNFTLLTHTKNGKDTRCLTLPQAILLRAVLLKAVLLKAVLLRAILLSALLLEAAPISPPFCWYRTVSA